MSWRRFRGHRDGLFSTALPRCRVEMNSCRAMSARRRRCRDGINYARFTHVAVLRRDYTNTRVFARFRSSATPPLHAATALNTNSTMPMSLHPAGVRVTHVGYWFSLILRTPTAHIAIAGAIFQLFIRSATLLSRPRQFAEESAAVKQV